MASPAASQGILCGLMKQPAMSGTVIVPCGTLTRRRVGRMQEGIGIWASPGPNALSPSFEAGFARLEYVGQRRFNMAYMRHTEKWWEVYQRLTLDECLKTVREEPLLHPPGC